MSYYPRTQGKTTVTKTTTTVTQSGSGGPITRSTRETSSYTSSQLSQPTKFSEQRVRIGRPGSSNAQEIITTKYQQPVRTTETKTRYDPKTGASQRITTTNYQPETKVTETRTRYVPVTSTSQTTTTKYQPSTRITETKTRYGPVTSSTQQTTTTKYQPSTKVTETRTRYGPSSSSNQDVYTTAPLKVIETKTRFGHRNEGSGPETKSSKQVTYTNYQQSRARPIEEVGFNKDKNNDVFVVSESRKEKYSNDNGKRQRYVVVEKTMSDGTKQSASLRANS